MNVRRTSYLALAVVVAGLAGCCSTSKSKCQGCGCGCGGQPQQWTSCEAPGGCPQTCSPGVLSTPQQIQLPLESVPSGKPYEEETPPPPPAKVDESAQRPYVTPMSLQASQPGDLRPAAAR